MTEEEKTELRIKAARVLCLIEPCEKDWLLIRHKGTPYERKFKTSHAKTEEEAHLELLAWLPHPLGIDADCNALLVATLDKRCSVLPGIQPTEGDSMGAWRFAIDGHHEGVYICLKSHRGGIEIDRWSENPDRHAAYREAVTRACVAAWEAETAS